MKYFGKRLEISIVKPSLFLFYFCQPDTDNYVYHAKTDSKTYYYSINIWVWKFYINAKLIPTKNLCKDNWCEGSKKYGFTFSSDALHIHNGKTKVYWLPWSWDCVRHDLLLPDGSLYHRNDYKKKGKSLHWYEVLEKKSNPSAEMQVAEIYKLSHITKYGEMQNATITLTGEEREWRWFWFKWLPFPRKVKRCVDFTSDIELGEKAGSWKGGLIGTSYKWEKGQTLTEAFLEWYKQWGGK